MPPKKPPPSLIKICLRAFADWFLKVWETGSQQEIENFGLEVHRFLSSHIPSVVADSLISQLLEMYVQRYECNPDMHMSIFLHCIMLPQLNVIDFSEVINLGINTIGFFEYVIASELHSHGRLVKISLQMHGRDSDLQLCTDHTLELIGKNCPQLKSLNVSYSGHVRNEGLQYLVPCSESPGCPLLEEIFVYKCAVSEIGVTNILRSLPNIRLIGYEKMVLCLLQLYEQMTRDGSPLKERLKLTHVENTSINLDRSYMRFDKRVVDVVCTLCPHLYDLKVHVADEDVPTLEQFESLTSLELTYKIQRPASPGEGTEYFLRVRGAQLSSLAITCLVLHEKQIIMLGENCSNLKHLYLKCEWLELRHLELEHDDALSKCKFFKLESLCFFTGKEPRHVSEFPVRVVQCILRNTDRLEELKIFVNTPSITDVWMNELLSSVNTAVLKELMIALPGRYRKSTVIDLSMSSVNEIISRAPHLQKLGNLIFWNVRSKKVWKLKRKMEKLNFDLNIIIESMTENW
ncbi:uncharacterized protein LOC110835434 [Zootermopsis nevadensis]|uniref:Uncharacterized protein n=1 Tax=Zootermopsis nevadensis TaxID=136037 RepID=A0A067R2W3_ZOONE|nr:uncharacterized protein LOC110835434 [Zootermopsis nevadensis]XP_021931332.1 uncharacterized protein LOC110835434 [Zootermopsis nevadensis]KDR13388.1 hypothetical protein L798_12478 [Zootermopsis nevadensis]